MTTLAAAPTALGRYELMVRMRAFEEACLSGVAAGEIHGEIHTAIGQEAVSAALAEHLRPTDALSSTHRNHLHAIAKGVPIQPMLDEIFERATGLCGGFGGHMHLFDRGRRFSTSGIVGASFPVALGHAYAMRIEGRRDVSVAAAGDGAVNTGAFHESMNMAGALKLPLVVLVENNEWAISVPFARSSATATIAERASAYGAWGTRVDGLDVGAVSEALAVAFDRARGGNGPAVVEAKCYRFRGHYEGDLDLYRDQQDKSERIARRDPLVLARQDLLASGAVAASELDQIEQRVLAELADHLEESRRAPWPDPSAARDHVFASGLDLSRQEHE